MRFIYIPCEQYASRWTEFVSGPDGVVETLLKRYKIDYLAIRPELGKAETMATGVVLDTMFRTQWAMNQIVELVRMFFAGAIEKDDVIYFEDFWTPGFEMIPYAADMTGTHPKIYSFCHAQSVDPHDFTAKMAPWMRAFEKAWAVCNTKIFTAAPELVTMLNDAFVRPNGYEANVAVGTIFDRSTLLRYGMVEDKYDPKKETRQKRVLFTSRWDKEKHPEFFMALAEQMIAEDDKVEFAICTGHKELKSNDMSLKRQAEEWDEPQFKIYTGLSKTDYYHLLRTSTVQFNCADQDFVSYTLLESAVFGCQPLYPNYLTFPAAMKYRSDYLYRKGDLVSAKEKLKNLLKNNSGFDGEFIYGKYQFSFERMLKEMGYDQFSETKDLVDILKR